MDWKAEYSVGIPEIDEQHQQLFDCIDRLESAKDDQQRDLAVYYVMDELKDYVRVHFSVEEIIMRLFDYPGLAAHAAEHRAFAERLEKLEQSELDKEAHAEVGKFLRQWLVNHIMITDKKYAEFVLGAGRDSSAAPRA
jgi:hemerythrin